MNFWNQDKGSDILFDNAPERPPTFRETPEERTEIEPLDDYDMSPDAPSFEPFEAHEDERSGEDDDEAIPVYMVGAAPTEERIRDWQSASYTVSPGPNAVMVLGRNRNRIRAVISVRQLAVGNFPIAIMRRSTDNRETAAMLWTTSVALVNAAAGLTQIELRHNDEVWVCSSNTIIADASLDPGVLMAVDVVSEFWVEDC